MPSALLDVGRSIGPLYIGSILNWMFMGVLIMQYYTYYQTFPTDQLILRITVNGLFILDIAQTITSTHLGWFFIITVWGNPADLHLTPWSLPMIPILCGVVTALVQMFYAWRVWVLAPNRFLKVVSTLIVALAFTQAILALIAGGTALATASLAEFGAGQAHPAGYRLPLWLSTSLVVDVAITSSMVYILTLAKNQSAWRPTETMLTAMIHRVVETGTASTICAAIDLAMFLSFPGTNIHFAPAYILGKVYTNSLMLTLNLRRPTSGSSHKGAETSFRMDETHRGAPRTIDVVVTRTHDMEGAPAAFWDQKGTEEYMPNRSEDRV